MGLNHFSAVANAVYHVVIASVVGLYL